MLDLALAPAREQLAHPDVELTPEIFIPVLSTVRALQQDERTRKIPVILLTAKVQAADRARFNNLGVAGLVAKPFDPMILHATVADLLGWSGTA